MEFSDIIRDRYSCKKYDGRQLSQEQLSAILEAGRLAPTAKNLQEQHVYVIQSEEGLAKVDEVTPCRFGAPTVLLVAFNKDDVFTYPGGKRTSGVEDATIVATHMLLPRPTRAWTAAGSTSSTPSAPARPSAFRRTRTPSCSLTSALPPMA